MATPDLGQHGSPYSRYLSLTNHYILVNLSS